MGKDCNMLGGPREYYTGPRRYLASVLASDSSSEWSQSDYLATPICRIHLPATSREKKNLKCNWFDYVGKIAPSAVRWVLEWCQMRDTTLIALEKPSTKPQLSLEFTALVGSHDESWAVECGVV